jgi:glycosyltransferase involved in cell wall biosynthesis
MRVCWFGAWDPGYPRNRILREGLERCGIEVVEARVRERRAIWRYPPLVSAYRSAPSSDVVFVPCFRHKDVPLARALAGRTPVVFDPLVSRHDTLVGDWGKHREGSAQAWWNRRIDRMAFRWSDAVLCDTWAHGGLFRDLGAPPERLHRIVVGAEDSFFELPDAPESGPIEILYAGGFLPLHGTPVLVEALSLLETAADRLPEYRVRLIGSGIEFDDARERARRLGVKRACFEGARPYAELPSAMARAQVVLGAFGSTDKAGRVVPHKVWQGLAAGRAVVTGDGEGVRELFEPGVHMVVAPRGDATALAAALREVLTDGTLRRRLGRAARERAFELGTTDRLGRELAGVLERTLEARS